MKSPIFVVLACVLPALEAAAEAVPFCLPVDRSQVERHLNLAGAAWPAGKRLADEPRAVRMVYYVVGDGYRAETVAGMKSAILDIQALYGHWTRAHGLGERTFRHETDAEGEPLVHVIYGDSLYYNHWDALEGVRVHGFDLETNVLLIVVGTEADLESRNVLGLGLQYGRTSGWALLTQYMEDGRFVSRAAHELGHAFGLWHNFNDGAFVMSYGPGQDRLSELAAGRLAVHPYFNQGSPEAEGVPPTGEVRGERSYGDGADGLPVRAEISDPEGLQQVSVLVTTREPHFSAGFEEIKDGRLLAGEKTAVFDFVYDGRIPSDASTGLHTHPTHRIELEVVDVRGNVSRLGLTLMHDSTHTVVIPLDRAKQNGAYGLAFSPDGRVLVSGSANQTVEIWNAQTGEPLGTLSGYPQSGYFRRVYSVAYSPDGSILATGTWNGVVKLWNMETETEIATLRHGGDDGRIQSLAFSPDGTMLASALTDDWTSSEHTVRLWDVATWDEIATLRGHGNGVQSVAFSPDGTLLASGAFDSSIRLWDVATWDEIAVLPYEDTITSLSFSPDGKTLMSSAFNRKVALWDVAARQFRDQFPVTGVNILRYAAFTKDGRRIVTGSQEGDIEVWEVDEDAGEYVRLADFHGNTAKTFYAVSAALSPDGTALATAFGNYAGQGDYTIVLWDLGPYVTPVVHVADFNLRTAIMEALGLEHGPITRQQMASITALDVSNRGIRTLIGLEFATGLATVDLEENPLNDSENARIADLRARGVEVEFAQAEPTDFDGDGTTGLSDFFLFADAFGGSDPRFDLDGNGAVDFADFFLLADRFGKP